MTNSSSNEAKRIAGEIDRAFIAVSPASRATDDRGDRGGLDDASVEEVERLAGGGAVDSHFYLTV